MKLPLSFFDARQSGDILQRIDDNRRIETFLSNSTLNVLFSMFTFVIFGVVLAYYNLEIFLLFLSGTVLYVLWVAYFLKKRAVLDYKKFDESSGNTSNLVQLIYGIKEIKLHNSERRRRWEWEAVQTKLFRISMSGLKLSQYQASGGTIINELKNILITFIAAKSVISGQMTLGMMLAVQYIIGQLNGPINGFVMFIRSSQDAKISIKRLLEIFKDESDQKSEQVVSIPANKSITFSNLSFRYGGRESPLILNDLNFSIPEGKVTAIVGPSGSGKTTLLKLLVKFYEPSTGKIEVGGTSLSLLDHRVWRNEIGAVMQDGFIFSDTIARNITESKSEEPVNKQRLIEAVRIANIEEMIDALPIGYNQRIGASGVQLSGGQKQRVLIARAVYKNPKYLIFDEATSALDANNEKVIMDNLQAYYEGRTAVVIAHRLSTVKNADQILVLDKGRIVESGNHEELTKKKGAYYTLVKNQLELGT